MSIMSLNDSIHVQPEIWLSPLSLLEMPYNGARNLTEDSSVPKLSSSKRDAEPSYFYARFPDGHSTFPRCRVLGLKYQALVNTLPTIRSGAPRLAKEPRQIYFHANKQIPDEISPGLVRILHEFFYGRTGQETGHGDIRHFLVTRYY